MADAIIAKQGQIKGAGDELAMFLKVFGGEVLTAFTRQSKVVENHMIKTIENGKSAQFPVMGRATAKYLKAGKSLDDQRESIQHNEKIITIDGLLTSDVLITDIYEAMNHYDVRQEYAKQLGEALAISADSAVVAEIAKLVQGQTENIAGLGAGIVLNKTTTGTVGINEETGKVVIDALLELKAKWTGNYVPMEERFVYLKPEMASAIIASKTAIDRDYGAVATIVDGNLDKLCGFKIIEVPHLTAGGADKTNMIGTAPEGHEFPTAYKTDVAFVASHRSGVGTLKLKDLAIEHARRPEYQADQIIAKYAMGHGGLRPEATAVCLIKKGV